MQRKQSVSQRPLFADWPAWQQLPTDVRQQLEHLLADMCLEVVKANSNSNDQEQSDEWSNDKESAS